MPLETGTYLSDLVPANPAATDGLNNADDHIRLIKATLKNTFPNINSTVFLNTNQLNTLFGDGSSTYPTYNYVSEPSLGIYRSSPGNMSFNGRLNGNGAIPPGFILDFAGSVAPSGWLPLDGTVLATASYPALFAAIGYTWGGSGASFALPNALNGGRFRRHRDNSTFSGGVGLYQAAAFGSHSHAGSGSTGTESADHYHTGGGTTTNQSADHTHAQAGAYISAVAEAGSFSRQVIGPTAAQAVGNYNVNTGGASAGHTHDYSFTTSGRSAAHSHYYSFTTTAVGDAFETRPYSMTVLSCIKT